MKTIKKTTVKTKEPEATSLAQVYGKQSREHLQLVDDQTQAKAPAIDMTPRT